MEETRKENDKAGEMKLPHLRKEVEKEDRIHLREVIMVIVLSFVFIVCGLLVLLFAEWIDSQANPAMILLLVAFCVSVMYALKKVVR